MQKIKRLPLQEIQKIAAGQVVERPVNVVKELVENSLDAGATKISIYCKNAGQSLIRSVDNGCGMSSLDAELCFERHATSKVSSFEELSALRTFGFRGEALYTIGAVSNVTMLTKEPESREGVRIIFNQGELKKVEPISCSSGTDISIEDLFCNVPARKKFLKKEETEWRLIVQLFQAFCFAYTDCHFQLYHDEQLVHNCPPVTGLIDRSAQIWGVHLAGNMAEVQTDGLIIKDAIISQHNLFRYNRSTIFFFVNKRWVHNYFLTQALLKGYLNVLPSARYPVSIISLSVDPAEIDSNIHPRKEEVSFTHQKQIENVITASVKKSLEKKVTVQLEYALEQQKSEHVYMEQVNKKSSFFEQPLAHVPHYQSVQLPERSALPLGFFDAPLQENKTSAFGQPIILMNNNDLKEQHTVSENPDNFEILGVLKKTYILLDNEGGILFVDQHAAHERILYEQYAGRFHEVASTVLLFPEIVYLSIADMKLIVDNILLLHEYGIMCDQKGENQLVISSIPVYLKSILWSEFIREIIDLFLEYSHLEKDQFFTQVNKKMQAQMACKAAVKAGDELTVDQINKLLTDLSKTENRFSCPHGRPTSWVLPLDEIEKKFKRRK